MELLIEGGFVIGSNGIVILLVVLIEGLKIVIIVVGVDDDLGIDGDEKVVNEEGVFDVVSLVVSG